MIGYRSFHSRHFIAELLTTTVLGLSLVMPAAAQVSPRVDPGAEAAGTSLESDLAQKDLVELLPLLLTSSDRRQLAADLESSIRKGDLKAAETSLNTAIEVGTLAIVLSDHLSNPNLLKALQDFNVQASAHPAPLVHVPAAEPAGACTAAAEISTANLAELQQALQQEQERSKTFRQELQRLQEEYQTLRSAKEQAAAQADIAASDNRLRQERERLDLAERQLASTLKDLRELQGLKDEIVASTTSRMAELEKALARAQMRSDVLTQELTAASDELRAVKEPRQPGPAPVMFRLAATGAEPPLGAAPVEAAPAPAAQASPLPPESPTAAQEATSSVPAKAPAPVVVAALPDSISPLPMASVPLGGETSVKAEPAKADDRLVSRGEELLSKGDVSGARLVLERALAGGHARAAFLLAETFDPNMLSKLGALGLKGDAAKARELYTQAQALGMAQARDRLEALR